jgi:hypothetical protein
VLDKVSAAILGGEHRNSPAFERADFGAGKSQV